MFSVLMVCLGNICRSPMAEVLLKTHLRSLVGEEAARQVRVQSAGTGLWNVGEPMNPPAAQELLARGADPAGFRARHLVAGYVAEADLILTATREHHDVVVELDPSAARRSFVMGEFGRYLPRVALDRLPAGSEGLSARGRALVEAVAALRGEEPPRTSDEIPDPWGHDQQFFTAVAEMLDETLRPLAAALAGEAETTVGPESASVRRDT
jgi:protein-tyrosine phosphatase